MGGDPIPRANGRSQMQSTCILLVLAAGDPLLLRPWGCGHGRQGDRLQSGIASTLHEERVATTCRKPRRQSSVNHARSCPVSACMVVY